MSKFLTNYVFRAHKSVTLINNFKIRNLSSSQTYHATVLNQVTVIGGGHMGRGIAQVSAAAGNIVTIADINESALQASRRRIEERLTKGLHRTFQGDLSKIKTEVDTIMKRIQVTTDIGKSVEKCDLVVEAIPENLDLKIKVFAELDKKAPKSTIFVTNTSSLLVQEICQHLSPNRKEQFGGVHFFEAVASKLVEVIKTPETSEDSYKKIIDWSQHIGKVTVTCKDTPGFIVNRLIIPYYLEAIRLHERGDASLKDIDIAMKFGTGYPFGPFEQADYLGIDVIYMVFQGWEKRYPNEERYRCPKTIKDLFEQGKLGVKTGEGFYKYSK